MRPMEDNIMDLVILDLEWNSAFNPETQSYLNEIIEFGAVRCGKDLAQKGKFSRLVRPRVGKKLNAAMRELTDIDEETLMRGSSFSQTVKDFKDFSINSVIATWGPADVLALIDNCKYFSVSEKVPFLSHFCDLQRYTQERLGLCAKERLGLEKAAELTGTDFSRFSLHRALDDSLLSLKILKRVYDRESFESAVLICDDEFYRRMTFKPRYIVDIEDPLINQEDKSFPCPNCGEACEADSEWNLRKKSLFASFTCPKCKTHFAGKLNIKQRYEGLTVKKKTFSIPEIEIPREAKAADLGNMELEILQGVGVLRFKAWENLSGINHAFSTRIGGVSSDEFASMNLGFSRGDPDANVSENFERFLHAAGFLPGSAVTGAQVHKTNIMRVYAEDAGKGVFTPKEWEEIDGLITNSQGVTLCIYCADCVPLYYYDTKHRAIGLSHAGWRGTALGMAMITVERMREEFGTDPEDLKVAIGPSICKDCFEVDFPVAEAFLSIPGSEFFVRADGGEKYHIDLWECNRRFLLDAGVKEENITFGNVCTMEESDLIFSHRKTRGQRGSNCAMLALTP